MHTLSHETASAPEGTTRVADLIGGIDHHHRYCMLLPSPQLSVLDTCWIVNTYLYEWFDYCPYLVLHSSCPSAGKSQLMEFISMLAYGNPPNMTDPSPASLYRGAS